MRFGVLSLILCIGFLGCKSEPVVVTPTTTTVFEDSFTAADGSAPSFWTITAAGGATFNIASNRLHPAQGGGASPSALFSTLLDKVGYTTTVDLIVSGGAYSGDAYIIAKSQSAASVDDSYVCGIDGPTGKVVLAVLQGGIETPLAVSATAAGPLADGTTASLSFDVQSFITVSMICTLTVNGTTYSVSADDTIFPNSGYWGLVGGKTGANYLSFDNFKIVN